MRAKPTKRARLPSFWLASVCHWFCNITQTRNCELGPKLLLAKYGLDSDGIYTRVKESVEVLEDRRAKHTKVPA